MHVTSVKTNVPYFCLCAICARTWASTLVGSWTASLPRTLIKLEILTTNKMAYGREIKNKDLVQTKDSRKVWNYNKENWETGVGFSTTKPGDRNTVKTEENIL